MVDIDVNKDSGLIDILPNLVTFEDSRCWYLFCDILRSNPRLFGTLFVLCVDFRNMISGSYIFRFIYLDPSWSEYLFASVNFPSSSYTYYYLTAAKWGG